MYRPGQLPGRSSGISGELQTGKCSYYPPEGYPGQLMYTFVILRRLAPKFQHSLSAVTLGIFLGATTYRWGRRLEGWSNTAAGEEWPSREVILHIHLNTFISLSFDRLLVTTACKKLHGTEISPVWPIIIHWQARDCSTILPLASRGPDGPDAPYNGLGTFPFFPVPRPDFWWRGKLYGNIFAP